MNKITGLLLVTFLLFAVTNAKYHGQDREIHPTVKAIVESPIVGDILTDLFFYFNYYVYFFFCNSVSSMYFYDYSQNDMVGMCMLAA